MESDKLARNNAQPGELGRVQSPYLPYGPAPEEATLGEYWRILVKRKWTVVAALLVVMTLATVVSLRTTPMYMAMGKIAIFRDGSDLVNFKDVGSTTSDDWDYTVAMDTQVKILQSDSMALAVAHNLAAYGAGSKQNLQNLSTIPLGTSTALDPKAEVAAISEIRSNLTITTIPNTRMIEIRFMSPDPNRAAQVVNTLTSTFIHENLKNRYESIMQASDWLQKQLADLQMKVEISQEKLVKYQKENDILGIDEKQNIVTVKLDELNKDLTAAQADRIQKEANYKLAQNGNAELNSGQQNALFDKLRTQETDLKTQLAQLSTQFGPSYPKVKEVRNQLAQVELSLQQENTKAVGRMQRDYQTAVQREYLLRNALEEQKAEANKLNQRAIQYNLLKRDVDTNRQLYEGLLQKLKEAGMAAGLRSSNIRVIDAARVPASPASPDIPRNLAIALLIGLTGGVALAFVREALDNTIRTPEHVAQIAQLPSLGIIPSSVRLAPKPANGKPMALAAAAASGRGDGIELVSHSRPKSEMAEAYRALRTSILLSSLGAPPKVILVTSALTAMAIEELGQRALAFTGRQMGIITDSVHTKARIEKISCERANRALGDGFV
ncbi:MAG TPA: GNVR domain-containing protein, partial [Terriglobales bacterium]|nr:GNVR domain-containing protein [Terriglobales bacterium]